jgi:taurine---2-oxoglutarate transaminase
MPAKAKSVQKIDWEQVKAWDAKYNLHVEQAGDEYSFMPIERMEGDWIYFPDGSKIFDMMNQLVCVSAGQCVPEIQNAIKEALDRFGYHHELFTDDYRAKASKLIIETMLEGEDWAGKVRYVSTGTEAVELAIMVAKLYTNRPYIVSRNSAYHGWSMGAGGLTSLPGYVAQMSSTTEKNSARFIPSHPAGGNFKAVMCDCYNCDLAWTYPECKKAPRKGDDTDLLPCVLATKRLFMSLEGRVAAFICETVPGAGSCPPPPPEYFSQLRKVCDDMGVLFIIDEVLMGFAKTGKWFAYQNWEGFTPDIITMAKSLVTSALPAAGIVVSKKIADYMESARWGTISTFGSHPVAMAAVVATLEYYIKNDACAKFRHSSAYFAKGLDKLVAKHKSFDAYFNTGMVFSGELVKNAKTKERFVPEDRAALYAGPDIAYPTAIIQGKGLEKGVLMGGFSPNTLRMSCSMQATDADLDMVLDALDYALDTLDAMCD